jgi:cytochrome c biogenesis protein CcmG/thiol:disulfide interchange protein DsbE
MRRPAATVCATVCAALLAFPTLAGCGSVEATRPTRLPDATLQPLRGSGTPVNLHDLRGPAVVSMWANWCEQCRTELPIYEAFHQLHPDVRIIGVDWEDPARSKALAVADAAKLSYPLIVDAKPVLRAQGLPKLFMVDAKGKIAYEGYAKISSLKQLEGLVRKHLGVDL